MGSSTLHESDGTKFWNHGLAGEKAEIELTCTMQCSRLLAFMMLMDIKGCPPVWRVIVEELHGA